MVKTVETVSMESTVLNMHYVIRSSWDFNETCTIRKGQPWPTSSALIYPAFKDTRLVYMGLSTVAVPFKCTHTMPPNSEVYSAIIIYKGRRGVQGDPSEFAGNIFCLPQSVIYGRILPLPVPFGYHHWRNPYFR